MKKAAVLFSGGKDSCYSAYLAKQAGYELVCLISMVSENPDSYMFHTPSINQTEKQAEVMKLPLITRPTAGEKEVELKDLESAVRNAIIDYDINVLITGAIKSEYQASRIKALCEKLGILCYNPLWHKDELEYLNELVKNKFKVIIVGVAAEGLDKKWLGREINSKFIKDVQKLHDKFQIHVAGEGGEFETFVLNCPLFKKGLKVKKKDITGSKNSWKMEVVI